MVESVSGDIAAVQELLVSECETIDAIYSEENVVAEQPNIVTVAKHTLARVLKPISDTAAGDSSAS